MNELFTIWFTKFQSQIPNFFTNFLTNQIIFDRENDNKETHKTRFDWSENSWKSGTQILEFVELCGGQANSFKKNYIKYKVPLFF